MTTFYKSAMAALALFLGAGASFPALAGDAADETPNYATDTLTGDWGGARTKLYNRGIDLGAKYTGDALENTTGGIKRGAGYLDNLNLTATLDGSKLYGLQGSTVFINVLRNSGKGFNARHVGSAEGVDNVEVGTQTTKLYEAWVEQKLFADKASVRVGLYDLNTEFDVTESSGLFINPTFGIDTALALTGDNGPSVFPTTSLGARFQLNPTENWALRFAVLDGVPGSATNAKGTHVHLADKDGALLVAEAARGALEHGRVGVGAMTYTKPFDHLDAVDGNSNPSRTHSNSVYGFAEKTLYKADKEGKRHLDGFVRAAATDGTVSQVDLSWATGLTYTGWCPSRAEDVAGLAIHGARNSDPYRRAQATAGNPTDAAEWGVEATYSASITPWASLQPDVQYIHNPGSTPGIDDAVVTMLRTKLVF